jgi:hypothetical protein
MSADNGGLPIGFRIVIAMAALVAVIAVVGTVSFHLLKWSKPMQQTYVKDLGYFYRFRADFEVKATGEKLNFDYVVSCNIRITQWRGGGLSDDSTASPRAMYRATREGQVVMVATLQACDGLTSEHNNIHPDVLPLAVWFETTADLSVGLGYASEDAYDNPLGKLTFHGARVDRATRDEWEAWRKSAAADYVQVGVLPGPWGYDFPARPDPVLGPYASACYGYQRLILPESMRVKLRAKWPADRPRFWAVSLKDEGEEIGKIIADGSEPWPPGVDRWSHRFGGQGQTGDLPVRSGRSVSASSQPPYVPSRWPSQVYPFLWPQLTSIDPVAWTPAAPSMKQYVQKVEYRGGALNGFAACQYVGDIDGKGIKRADPGWLIKRRILQVDDVAVRDISDEGPGMYQQTFIVEQDISVFVSTSMLF